MMLAALVADGRVVTGCHHGEAFSKLNDREKESDLRSGFIDPETLKFVSEEGEFYLKKILIFRHADAEGQDVNCHITTVGRSQAALARAFVVKSDFKDYEWFSSPLCRCRETADIMFQHITGLADLQNQRLDENTEIFTARILHVLDTLPVKSIVISHCDTILEMIWLATGVHVPPMANCAGAFVENGKVALLEYQ